MRLLLVEDDPMIGESLSDALQLEGYAVDWVRDARSAELGLAQRVHDLMLLDLGLGTQDGLDVLRTHRAQGGTVPVLVVSARDARPERVRGLDAGADDYLSKPFDLDELLARVRALLRRHAGTRQRELVRGGLVVDTATHEVRLNGEAVELSARQFNLLRALMMAGDAVISRATLAEKIYGWDENPDSNTVDVFIHQLRRKLGNETILTVRGAGFRMGTPP